MPYMAYQSHSVPPIDFYHITIIKRIGVARIPTIKL